MTPAQINFFTHVAIIVMFVLWMIPLLGDWGFYKFALWATFASGIYTIKSNYGLPQVTNFSFSNWRESLIPVQMWAARCLQGAEMHYIMFSMVWGVQPANILVMIILLRRSIWSACVHASKHHQDSRMWGLVSSTWTKLQASEQYVLEQTTMLELMLLVIPIVSIFTVGLYSLMSLYMHISFLRIRYHSPDQSRPTKPAVLHRRAWATISQKTQPIFNAVPVLKIPLNYVTTWFMSRQ